MTRPSDQIKDVRSYTIQWKGNKPVIKPSHWAPGYTDGHTETEAEAIAMEVAHLMKNIADFREKWLNLNLLAEQLKHNMAADAFGNLLSDDPTVSITETDDPHETMTMPEGAQDVPTEYPGEWNKEE